MMSCLFCGNAVEMIQVHGHYQCPVCKTNALPCCDGDNSTTNFLLKENNPVPLKKQFHLITGNTEMPDDDPGKSIVDGLSYTHKKKIK